MRSIKITFMSLTIITTLCVVGLYVTGNDFILTAVKRTYLSGNITANINDHRVFNVRDIPTAKPNSIKKHDDYSLKPLDTHFLQELERDGAAAFLILKDQKIISENYFNGYHHRSKTNSFSMAKTVTALLLGIAIDEGIVSGLDQAITDFIPEFKHDAFGQKATVGQFLLMNSGYEWDEKYYTPFSPTVELYYGNDIQAFLTQGKFTKEPGTFWEYSSASTQIIGVFLSRALQKSKAAKNLSEYLSKKIWKPLQMNDDALWHLDNSGMELVYCCINTNARNFAKLGVLMLNKGQWKGQQIVSKEFINEMLEPNGQSDYGLSIWLSVNHSPSYYWFSGHLGQYIINVPEHNLVVVRLGEKRQNAEDFRTVTLPKYIKMALTVL